MTWPIKKLGEIAQITSGGTPSRDNRDYFIGEIIWLKSGELNDNSGINDSEEHISDQALNDSNAKMFPKGTILLAMYGATTGKLGILSAPATTNQAIAGIIVDKRLVYNKFLFYYLLHFREGLIAQAWGGAQPNISQGIVKNIEIPLPPIVAQRIIVGKIERLFAKIDEAATLRQAALEDSAALLPSALHHIFACAEKEGWEEKQLSEVAIINPSKSEIKHLPDILEVSFVPMAAVSEQSQSIEDRQIRKLGQVRKGYTYFKDGDVLFAKITPSMENGKIALADNLKNGIGFGTTEFHVIRPTKNILSEWIKHFLWNPFFRDEAERHMTGTAGQQRVPVEFIEKSKIPLPPIADQKKIVVYLDSLSSKSRQLQELQIQAAEDLSALRQSILHQAFSGA